MEPPLAHPGAHSTKPNVPIPPTRTTAGSGDGRRGAGPDASEDGGAQPNAGSRGATVLIVEDNDGVRNMLARTLELKGFDVRTAANGREALGCFADFHPTIAIVDIGLPDLNGYEVARKIRQMPEHKQLLLVAVTGYGRDRDRETAIAAGFDIHLVKPLDPNELLRAIAEKYTASSLAAPS